MSCNKAWTALSEKGQEIAQEINAKKESFSGDAALEAVKDAVKIYVASGRNILEFDPKTADKDLLLKKITGPSGNLRAPALRKGKVFYIGFSPEMYSTLA